MNENQNYGQPKEIIITFQKLWDNFKKYWWICAITTVLAIIVVVGITIKNYQFMKNLSEDDLIKIDNNFYQAVSMIYMKPEEEKISEDMEEVADNLQNIEKSYTASFNEYVKTYIEQWNWNKNNQLLYDCMALLSSERVQSQINEALENRGMEPYDKVMDSMIMEIASGSRFYRVIVRGEDADRTEFISNTATSILLKEVQTIMGITNANLIDKATVDLCQKQEDGTYKILTNESEKKSMGGSDNLSIGQVFSINNILIVFIGVFLGLGIIFIFVLMDRKVRNRNEVNMYLQIPYLGEVSRKSGNNQYAVVTTTIKKKCEQESIKKVLLTTPKTCDIQDRLVESLGNEGENNVVVKVDSSTKQVEEKIMVDGIGKDFIVVSTDHLLESSNAIKAISSVDGIIILITVNGDDIPELEETISHIKTVGGKVLGYVLYK